MSPTRDPGVPAAAFRSLSDLGLSYYGKADIGRISLVTNAQVRHAPKV